MKYDSQLQRHPFDVELEQLTNEPMITFASICYCFNLLNEFHKSTN